MQTFSERIKEELGHYEYDRNAMRAILASFLSNNLVISIRNDGETWELKTQQQSTIKLLKQFISELYGAEHYISYSNTNTFNKKRSYLLVVKNNLKKISKDLQLNEIYPNTILKTIIDQRAYLVGAFLSGGSVSSIDKSFYHLEIRSNKFSYLRLIQKILNNFKISITLLKRKSIYVLYIKKAMAVSDFLKIIGANDAMVELEDKIIARDYYTNIQRMNNLDVANIHKSSSAGMKQLAMIHAIKKSDEFKKQPDKFRFFCSIRLQNPSSSLNEIVKIFHNKYQITITRTGINHYVLKIKQIYNYLTK